MAPPFHILLVGCGNIGYALLKGWFSRNGGAQFKLHIVTPRMESLKDFQHHPSIRGYQDPSLIKEEMACIFFAVKPGIIQNLLPLYGRFHKGRTLFAPLIAGKTLSFYREILGYDLPLVRVMPNTPSTIGLGMNLLLPGLGLTENHRQLIEDLIKPLGHFLWMQDENQFDLGASLAACGPGFIFYLVQVFAEVGTKMGIESNRAEEIARWLFIGSGAYLHNSSESSSALCRQVASPGGMTEAGLKVCQSLFPSVVERVLTAAYERALKMREEH